MRNRGGDHPGRPRPAFTLVEILVVIAIIAGLIAILLPAVQAAREAGRRLQCANNIRQLALAVLGYESNQGMLPPSGLMGRTSSGDVDPQSGKMFNWIVFVLPYMEEVPLYNRFDFSRALLDQPDDLLSTSVTTLLCPDDSAQGRTFVDSTLTQGKHLAKGNYAAFVSPYHVEFELQYPGAIISTGQRMATIVDGTSSTLMLAEIRTRGNPQDQRGAWTLPWTGATLLAFDMHAEDDCPPDKYVPNDLSLGETQLPNNQGPNLDMLYLCPDEAGAANQQMPCATWSSTGEWAFLSAAPRSLHPGGVNTTFVDGHVTFLKNDVDQMVMAYLISINDGQSIDMSQFGN